MYEQDAESDEDCEVYFLKPVNEYNIVDKIKEANKELFAELRQGEIYADVADELDAGGDASASQRKVTFAPNLETYAPDRPAEPGMPEIGDGEGTKAAPHSEGAKFNVIDEEPFLEDEQQAEATEADAALVLSQHSVEERQTYRCERDDDIELEEICEEIIIMDMEGKHSSGDSNAALPMRRMLKQTTFDYADEQQREPEEQEEYNNVAREQSDNRSLNNLFTSDIDEDEQQALEEALNYELVDNDDEDDDDEDDDDQLSLIVASYLPNDYGNPYYDTGKTAAHVQSPAAAAAGTKSSGSYEATKPRRTPLTKRFSLRRKVSSGSNCKQLTMHAPPSELTDLKLNYKLCCEYRHAAPEQLPHYTGFLSEYGLSAAQLAMREEQRRRKQRYVLQQTLQVNERQMHKMEDNERAFVTWLRNKMRCPSNKTRNMYDAKSDNSSPSGGSAASGYSGSAAALRKRSAACSGKSKK